MRDFYQRHAKVALMFSGGRDSLACLKLAAPYLERTVVVWVNPGNPYPQTVEQMARVREAVPHFVEVTGQQPEFIAANGHPVDVVPLSMTSLGQLVGRHRGSRVCATYDCCMANLWRPAHEYLLAEGFTGVIRGDRQAESRHSPVASGDTVDGIEHLFPLADLSDEQVTVMTGDWLPDHYQRGVHTSLDCINCTGYLDENVARLRELASDAPAVHAEVVGVLRAVRAETMNYLRLIAQTEEGA